MSDLCERLRTLAEALEGCEWELPLTSREDCLAAADEIERLRARVHVCPTCGEECVECQCIRNQLAECRRLLREAVGWCDRTDFFELLRWRDAARKAQAGGDDE